jgi:hypothetical protein
MLVAIVLALWLGRDGLDSTDVAPNIIESAGELFTFLGLFSLTAQQLLIGIPLTWVHLWAYHAVAPHVTVDTPHVVKIFGIR